MPAKALREVCSGRTRTGKNGAAARGLSVATLCPRFLEVQHKSAAGLPAS